MKYYISDLHLGHENIINICHRPFSSIEEMDNTIIQNWNNTVKDNDEVYILGDLAYKFKPDKLKEYLTALKGRKFLIFGNHDTTIRKNVPKGIFEWVKDYAEINDCDRRLVLSHYPMVEWNGFFRGTIHLYGHIHNNITNQAFKIVSQLENAYNVGAEILDYTPRTLEDVIEYNKQFFENNKGITHV